MISYDNISGIIFALILLGLATGLSIFAYRDPDRKGLQVIYFLIGFLISFALVVISLLFASPNRFEVIIAKFGYPIMFFPLFIYELEIRKKWFQRAFYIIVYGGLIGYFVFIR